MNDLEKLLVAGAASVGAHVVLGFLLVLLPRFETKTPQKVTVQVVEPPHELPKPEPEPPKPPEPPPPPKTPPKVVHEAPHPAAMPQADVPKDVPPPEHAPTSDSTDEPVFGATMESTSPGGAGPALPIGNTPRPEVGAGSAAPVKQAPEPVQAFEATKMPLPQGRCYGKYNDEALKAGIEGQVVLDIIVGENGHVRDIHVVQGLGHGLDEAAIDAIKACTFSPGEKDGKPVAVRIRGFKITFVLPEQ
jgi:protein TonB